MPKYTVIKNSIYQKIYQNESQMNILDLFKLNPQYPF
jgi:hypothetical protein